MSQAPLAVHDEPADVGQEMKDKHRTGTRAGVGA